MKRSSVRQVVSAVLAIALLSLPATADACGVCMGRVSDSQIPGAVNAAVFMMLAFIGSMLAGIGGVGYSIYRRSRNPLMPGASS